MLVFVTNSWYGIKCRLAWTKWNPKN